MSKQNDRRAFSYGSVTIWQIYGKGYFIMHSQTGEMVSMNPRTSRFLRYALAEDLRFRLTGKRSK